MPIDQEGRIMKALYLPYLHNYTTIHVLFFIKWTQA